MPSYNLTLNDVAVRPELLMKHLRLPCGSLGALRPLRPGDRDGLLEFLRGLTEATRRFYSISDPQQAAIDMCEGIDRYDKLRLILLKASERIVALLEFSFDITESDIGRYVAHGLPLDPATDCRFGLCVTDDRQNRGVGTLLLPLAVEVARRFGQRRMILWGGVHAANRGALHFYLQNGFREAGRFVNQGGVASIDMYLLLK